MFALVDSRIRRRAFGHGDLFLSREDAEEALAEVIADEPWLEPFLSVQDLGLPAPNLELALPAAVVASGD